MDTFIALAWSALAWLWPFFLVGAPIAFLLWAAIGGRRADIAALEKGKTDIEARAAASPSAISRGTHPGGTS